MRINNTIKEINREIHHSKTDLSIVLLCNKLDFFLTKICAASIRYYYPSIPLYIVKDEINGKFPTKTRENKLKVKVLDFGFKKYGYCIGKICVLLSKELADKKILLLDSDIVFVGKVLDKIFSLVDHSDFIVTPAYYNSYTDRWFKKAYYDIDWAKQVYPELTFPGYAFNCGAMVVTPGKIKETEMIDYVNLSTYPYWTDKAFKHLPCRDQSLLNILLPLKQSKGEITLKQVPFQIWSETRQEIEKFRLDQIAKEGYPFLIHWAGAVRIPYLSMMTRSDILFFFQKEYYKRLVLGNIRFKANHFYFKYSFYIMKGIKRIKNSNIVKSLQKGINSGNLKTWI